MSVRSGRRARHRLLTFDPNAEYRVDRKMVIFGVELKPGDRLPQMSADKLRRFFTAGWVVPAIVAGQ